MFDKVKVYPVVQCNHEYCGSEYSITHDEHCEHELKSMTVDKTPTWTVVTVWADIEHTQCDYCLDSETNTVLFNGKLLCTEHYARINSEIKQYEKRIVRFGAT